MNDTPDGNIANPAARRGNRRNYSATCLGADFTNDDIKESQYEHKQEYLEEMAEMAAGGGVDGCDLPVLCAKLPKVRRYQRSGAAVGAEPAVSGLRYLFTPAANGDPGTLAHADP